MILLVNGFDDKSRQFIKRLDTRGVKVTVIDWYNDPTAAKEYIASGRPSPSDFPYIVKRLPQTGGLPEEWYGIAQPASFDDAQAAFQARIAEREAAGATLPPLPDLKSEKEQLFVVLENKEATDVEVLAAIRRALLVGVITTNS